MGAPPKCSGRYRVPWLACNNLEWGQFKPRASNAVPRISIRNRYLLDYAIDQWTFFELGEIKDVLITIIGNKFDLLATTDNDLAKPNKREIKYQPTV